MPAGRRLADGCLPVLTEAGLACSLCTHSLPIAFYGLTTSCPPCTHNVCAAQDDTDTLVVLEGQQPIYHFDDSHGAVYRVLGGQDTPEFDAPSRWYEDVFFTCLGKAQCTWASMTRSVAKVSWRWRGLNQCADPKRQPQKGMDTARAEEKCN